jgi:hypothetical protein
MTARRTCGALVLTLALGGCAAEEAPRVELPVRVDCSRVTGAEATVTTDLGYAVTVTDARLALGGLVFTIAGEVHTASLMQRLSDAFVPRARAHPGHYQGGEVTGELPGDFALRCGQDQDRELGLATLIVGTYTAANFDFERGSTALGLDASDGLVGHTLWLSGTATRDEASIAFTVILDSPLDRQLVGAPFDVTVPAEATGALEFRFELLDDLEGDTLFDGVDFATLDTDTNGDVVIAPDVATVADAYNALRRTFQTHDHFRVDYQE